MTKGKSKRKKRKKTDISTRTDRPSDTDRPTDTNSSQIIHWLTDLSPATQWQPLLPEFAPMEQPAEEAQFLPGRDHNEVPLFDIPPGLPNHSPNRDEQAIIPQQDFPADLRQFNFDISEIGTEQQHLGRE